jgi:hypothetical protein
MRPYTTWAAAINILAGLLFTHSSLGQSSFAFVNYIEGGLDAPVFDSTGNRLTGSDYVAMLYGGLSTGSLAPAYVGAQVMTPTPFTYRLDLGGGYFSHTGYVEIQGVPGGATVWLQVRAWDARLGTSYEDVVALGIGGYGESNLFQRSGGDPGGGVPTPPEPLFGLQSFSLIPEPNSTNLVLIGLPLFLWRYRR